MAGRISIAKVKFSYAFLELSSLERFCKEICRLLLRGGVLYFDSIILYILTSEMVIDFKVF